jgi:hypothetical protein
VDVDIFIYQCGSRGMPLIACICNCTHAHGYFYVSLIPPICWTVPLLAGPHRPTLKAAEAAVQLTKQEKKEMKTAHAEAKADEKKRKSADKLKADYPPRKKASVGKDGNTAVEKQ